MHTTAFVKRARPLADCARYRALLAETCRTLNSRSLSPNENRHIAINTRGYKSTPQSSFLLSSTIIFLDNTYVWIPDFKWHNLHVEMHEQVAGYFYVYLRDTESRGWSEPSCARSYDRIFLVRTPFRCSQRKLKYSSNFSNVSTMEQFPRLALN